MMREWLTHWYWKVILPSVHNKFEAIKRHRVAQTKTLETAFRRFVWHILSKVTSAFEPSHALIYAELLMRIINGTEGGDDKV